MLQRTITGFFITLAIYLLIYFSYIPAVIVTAAVLLSVAAVYEVYHASGIASRKWFLALSMLLAAAMICLPNPYYTAMLMVIFPLTVLTYVRVMARLDACRLDTVFHNGLTALLLVFLLKAMPELGALENGAYYLAGGVTICFVTDISAFLIGKALGKHKLLPKVSPAKTMEGAIGGIVCSAAAALLFGVVLDRAAGIGVDYALLLVYALLTSIVGQFGDLSMSALKRICGVKDFGRLFPGHGGVLDRFDSILFAMAFTLLFCRVSGGFLTA